MATSTAQASISDGHVPHDSAASLPLQTAFIFLDYNLFFASTQVRNARCPPPKSKSRRRSRPRPGYGKAPASLSGGQGPKQPLARGSVTPCTNQTPSCDRPCGWSSRPPCAPCRRPSSSMFGQILAVVLQNAAILALDRLQHRHDRVGHGRLERAIALALKHRHRLVHRAAGGRAIDREQVVHAARSGSAVISPRLSVTARFTLRTTASASSIMEIKAFGLGSDLLILAVGSCRLMMRAPTFGMYGSGTTNVSPYALLKPDGHVARQLQMLFLIRADGHQLRLIQQDVRRHLHRIGEQAALMLSACLALLSLNCVMRLSSPIL